MTRILLILAVMASPAAAETRYICWRGEGGFTMTGEFSFPDSLAAADLVTEADVTAFRIEGWRDGEPLGSWNLSDRTADTTWLLSYAPRQGRFLLGGDSGLYQAWNANGMVDDCGDPGFGFNAGNAGQDVCVDGVFRADSTIAWDTPLLTYGAPRDPLSCDNAPLMSKARG
ncbi:hypothetical protein [Wenxinia marina]|uniref:Uncharacterized protein n=1 Tax=Wenxinia marina DSM 24838 TaxID=1123501 RepID=A0A0D0QDA4_9RHOB|nr:hypothetical protein [Wenxinia marina]KIQ70297.1 hypothetical protein Wenmar_00672 [Wenxinia marina DSM 24838]GGL54207.1 hypothetical protein GCM10011392_05790 [Wenxinia marina]